MSNKSYRHSFYNSGRYRTIQSQSTSDAWSKGRYAHLKSDPIRRACLRSKCGNEFNVLRGSIKKFCSSSCSAIHNNKLRKPRSLESRLKTSQSLTGLISSRRGKEIVPRVSIKCLLCGKSFRIERWKTRKYCTNRCAIKSIGSKPTSPRAARGKYGVRPDIDPQVCFYSRWEANFARILNLLKIRWEFQPKTFDIGGHTYTPDFYLPGYNSYIEIKNYLSEYSKGRDESFRRVYPNTTLILILRENYVELQDAFSRFIDKWEP